MRIVSLLSGGLDSSVLLFRLKAMGEDVFPLSIDYGQRHRRELQHAGAIAQAAGFPWKLVELVALKNLAPTSALTSDSIAVPDGHYEDPSMRITVVPNRNMALLSLAAAYAIAQGASAVAIAAHAGDHAVYPDCRPEFYDALGEALQLCDYQPIRLLRPFVHRTKAELVIIGEDCQTPFALTWSCYQGGRYHCGKCGTCVERKEAFQLAGVEDPTRYEDGGMPSDAAFGSGGAIAQEG